MRALGDDIHDGISSGEVVDGGNSENPQENTTVGRALVPTNHGRGHFEAEAAVPHCLAMMMLHEELDVSCRLGYHAAGRRDETMEDSDGCQGRDAAGVGSVGTDG